MVTLLIIFEERLFPANLSLKTQMQQHNKRITKMAPSSSAHLFRTFCKDFFALHIFMDIDYRNCKVQSYSFIILIYLFAVFYSYKENIRVWAGGGSELGRIYAFPLSYKAIGYQNLSRKYSPKLHSTKDSQLILAACNFTAGSSRLSKILSKNLEQEICF